LRCQQDDAGSAAIALTDGGGTYATAQFGKLFGAKRNVQSTHQELSKVGMAPEV